MTYKIKLRPGITQRTITQGDLDIVVKNGETSENEVLAALYPSIFIPMETVKEVKPKTVKKEEPKEELLVEAPVEVEAEIVVEEEKPKPKRRVRKKATETKED